MTVAVTHIHPDAKSIPNRTAIVRVTERIVRFRGIDHHPATKTDVANRTPEVAPDPIPVRIIVAVIVAADPDQNQRIDSVATNTMPDDEVTPVRKIAVAVRRGNRLAVQGASVEAAVAADKMVRRNENAAIVVSDQVQTIHSGAKGMANRKRTTRATRRSSDGQTINLMKTIGPVDRMRLDEINAIPVTNEMVGNSMMAVA